LDFGDENENLPSEFERRGSILLIKTPLDLSLLHLLLDIIDLDLSIFTYMLRKYSLFQLRGSVR
jgi:hypothetical protein